VLLTQLTDAIVNLLLTKTRFSQKNGVFLESYESACPEGVR
jgi:hypothetical protein